MNTSKFLLSIAGMGFGIGGAVLGSIPIAGLGLGVATVGALSGIGGKNLDFIFRRCKLEIKDEESPRLISYCRNEIGDQYTYSIPCGMSIADFKKKEQEISQALQRDIEIKLVNNKLVIQTLEKQLRAKYSLDLSNFRCNDMRFRIGRDRSAQEVLLDLSGNDTHSLIVGTTGSGKSVALNVLIVQFILAGIELSLIDLKAVEFVLYQDFQGLKGFAIDEQGANEVLQETLQEMNSRYQLLLKSKCKNYQDYNKRYPRTAIKPRIVIIDEFQSLCDDKASKKLLFLLLSKARASNIIILLSCQSPRFDIVDGKLRDNIKNYLIFKCETDKASEVATAEQGNYSATKLRGKGHGLLKNANKYTEFQGYYLSDDEIEQYIRAYCSPNKAPQEQQQVKQDNIIQIQNKRPTDLNKAQEYRQQDNKGSSTLRDLDAILSRIDAL